MSSRVASQKNDRLASSGLCHTCATEMALWVTTGTPLPDGSVAGPVPPYPREVGGGVPAHPVAQKSRL